VEWRCDSEATELECVEYPAQHIAVHHAAFFSTSAFCKVQLILRSGVAELEQLSFIILIIHIKNMVRKKALFSSYGSVFC